MRVKVWRSTRWPVNHKQIRAGHSGLAFNKYSNTSVGLYNIKVLCPAHKTKEPYTRLRQKEDTHNKITKYYPRTIKQSLNIICV